MTLSNFQMVINSIKVFARLKKDTKSKKKWYDIVRKNKQCEDIIIYKEEYAIKYNACKYRFSKVFDQDTDQDIIFDTVARPVVTRISVLQGFNGTIFAYGQTGSGKTYTMTGSTKRYAERGIIPRSLQFIFSTIEKDEEKPILYISYMEIYNEICYDLLNPKDNKTALRLEELSRVAILENSKGEPHLKNLSIIPVYSEEEAMRLLFLGDTNRAIAETPLNEYSSRSHCIFTIYITSRLNGSLTLRHSKLNMVDLAGSERVYKSNIIGTILNEAKHINLSLHFLQQVILALSESKRIHIPYRNSLMTFILKDSLAGNCLTVMLTTLATSKENMLETISTCKFAQRVSLIKTDPLINEVSDPHQEILLLRSEIQELRKQLADRDTAAVPLDIKPLTNLQKENCLKYVEEYLKSTQQNFNAEVNPKMMQYSIFILKNKIKELQIKQEEEKQKEAYSTLTKSPKKLQKDKDEQEAMDDSILQQMFMTKYENCDEINHYNNALSNAYKKAKILAEAIEECQTSISYIREKLDVISKAGCSQQKCLLSQELEYHQRIYRKSLLELKDLKHETLQLESGLKKAKTQMMHKYKEWIKTRHSSIGNHEKNAINFDSKSKIYQTLNDCSCSKTKINQCPYKITIEDHSVDSIPEIPNLCKRNFNQCYDLPESFMEYDDPREEYCLCKNQSNASNNLIADNMEFTNQKRITTASGFLPKINNYCCYETSSTSFKNTDDKLFSDNYPSTNNCNCKEDLSQSNCGFTLMPKINFIRNSYSQHCGCTDACYQNTNSRQCLISDCAQNCKSYHSIKPRENQFRLENYHNDQYNMPKAVRFECNNYSSHNPDLKSSISYNTIFKESNKNCYNTLPKKAGSNQVNDISSVSNINACKESQLKSILLTPTDGHVNEQFVPHKLINTSTNFNFNYNKVIIGEEANLYSPKCQEKQYQVSLITNNKEAVSLMPGINEGHNKKYVELRNENKMDLEQNNLFDNVKTQKHDCDAASSENKNKCDIFLETDTSDFRKFMEAIPMTGDIEIDKEICEFYRDKLCS